MGSSVAGVAGWGGWGLWSPGFAARHPGLHSFAGSRRLKLAKTYWVAGDQEGATLFRLLAQAETQVG
jgi:hypothetical protein